MFEQNNNISIVVDGKSIAKRSKKDKKSKSISSDRENDVSRIGLKEFHKSFELIRAAEQRMIEDNTRLRESKELLESKLLEQNTICDDYKDVCDRYQKIVIERDNLRESVDQSNKRNSELLDINRKLNKSNKRMKKQMQICNEKVSNVTKTMRNYRDDADKWSKIGKENDTFHLQCDELERENENLREKNASLLDYSKQLEKEFDSLIEKFKQFADYDAMHNKNERLTSDNKTMKEELNIWQKKCEEQAISFSTRNDQLADDNKTLKEELKMWQKKCEGQFISSSIRNENIRLHHRIEQSEKALDEQRIANTKLNKDSETLCQTHDHLLTKYRVLRQKYFDLKGTKDVPSDEINFAAVER